MLGISALAEVGIVALPLFLNPFALPIVMVGYAECEW